MHMNLRLLILLLATTSISFGDELPKPAATPAPEALVPQLYVDLYNGFSLRPPAQADRNTQRTPSQIVSWTGRQGAQTVHWTLSISNVKDGRDKSDLKEHAQTIAQTLRDKENFQIEAVNVLNVAGHEAFEVQGQTKDQKALWWQKQVWIGAKDKFLVFRITGPLSNAPQMEALLAKVLQTVEIINPQQALERRNKNLQAGRELLKGLTDQHLLKAHVPGTRWYLIHRQDKVAGFMHVKETMSDRDGRKLIQVELAQYIQADKTNFQMKLKASCTVDRKHEQWSQEIVSDGAGALSLLDQGGLEGDNISHTMTFRHKPGSHPRTASKKVPQDIYMPMAMSLLLPRMVDLRAKGTYSFARYAPQDNSFDVHTMAVGPLEGIEGNDGPVQARRLEIQLAEDAPPETLWINESGMILRWITASGCIATPSDKAGVLSACPQAKDMVKE